MCSDCLFAHPPRSRLSESHSLLKIFLLDSFTLAAEGTAPFLIYYFFFPHSSPPSCVSKGCNYTLGKWCCLSASSREFDLSWLPALTCLGRARKGNGWELPSNHELVLPPSFSFFFSPSPSLPHLNQKKDRAASLRKNGSESLVRIFFFFPSLSNETGCESLPFPCVHNKAGRLLQKAECACL